MPIPIADQFSPEMLRLIELVEGNLHFIVRQIDTREQAIELKRRLGTPLGAMNSRFTLQTNSVHTIRSYKAVDTLAGKG